jgi:pimeloyl-ACP methyl ester carboxylesterase
MVDVIDALGLDRFFLLSHDRGTVIADHLCSVPRMASRIRRYVRMQQSGNRPHSEPRPPHEMFDRELDDRKNGLFAAMSMPVLFLQGGLDPEAGHFLHLEDPPGVTEAIRAFLAREDLPA